MEELYWITRLDAIRTLFIVFAVFSALITALGIITYFVNKCEYYSHLDEKYANEKKADLDFMKTGRNIAIISFIVFLPFLCGATLIPKTKDALMIYGAGSIIDYVKGNEKIKQLPDKCVTALDLWLNSLNKDQHDKE